MAREKIGIFIPFEVVPYIRILPKEKRGELFTMLLEYGANDTIPDFHGDDELRIIFRVVTCHTKVVLSPTKSRDTKEYREWRAAVFERDNYTCQMCGKRGGKLNAHHKERYCKCVERRTDVSNGVTLCESCHRLLHKVEGI